MFAPGHCRCHRRRLCFFTFANSGANKTCNGNPYSYASTQRYTHINTDTAAHSDAPPDEHSQPYTVSYTNP